MHVRKIIVADSPVHTKLREAEKQNNNLIYIYIYIYI